MSTMLNEKLQNCKNTLIVSISTRTSTRSETVVPMRDIDSLLALTLRYLKSDHLK